jgi:hypothetical protein
MLCCNYEKRCERGGRSVCFGGKKKTPPKGRGLQHMRRTYITDPLSSACEGSLLQLSEFFHREEHA